MHVGPNAFTKEKYQFYFMEHFYVGQDSSMPVQLAGYNRNDHHCPPKGFIASVNFKASPQDKAKKTYHSSAFTVT